MWTLSWAWASAAGPGRTVDPGVDQGGEDRRRARARGRTSRRHSPRRRPRRPRGRRARPTGCRRRRGPRTPWGRQPARAGRHPGRAPPPGSSGPAARRRSSRRPGTPGQGSARPRLRGWAGDSAPRTEHYRQPVGTIVGACWVRASRSTDVHSSAGARSGARRPGPARPGRRVGPDLQLRAPADPQLHPRAVDPARLHRRHGLRAQERRSTATPSWAGSGRCSAPILNAIVYYFVFGVLLKTSKGVDNYPAFLIIGVFTFTYTQRVRHRRDQGDRQQPRAHPRDPLPPGGAAPGGDRPGGPAADRLPGDPVRSSSCLTGEPITWLWLGVIPVVLLQTMFNAGLCMMVARWTAASRDVTQLVPFVMQTWRYLSGVCLQHPRVHRRPRPVGREADVPQPGDRSTSS